MVFREKKTKASKLYDYAPVGMVVLDESLRFVNVNAACSKFLGYGAGELMNLSLLDVIHSKDLWGTYELAQKLASELGFIDKFKKRFLKKSGKTVWGMVTIRSVIVESEKNPVLFAVIEDVTEMQKKEQELKIAEAQLASSARMASLGRMAGGVAHEINNPLAIIKGKAEYMMEVLKEGEMDRDLVIRELELINTTSDRIAKIVSGLMTFSRSSGTRVFEKSSVDKIVQDTFDLCGERFKRHGIHLRIISPGAIEIECRPAEISQILMNLLSNSFDAMEKQKEKWIEIEIQKGDNQVSIAVKDSGPIISEEIRERLMEPFFTTKEIGKGAGIGLSVSKGIAESHHGSLTYVQGQNTCFCLILPIRQDTAQDQPDWQAA